MAQFFEIHPIDPQPRLIRQAAAILRDGGVIAYPTDSSYALGCHLGDSAAAERIRRIRGTRRRSSSDARVARSLRDRPLRAPRQLAVPHRPSRHAGPVHLRAAGNARGAAPPAASAAQHRRRARSGTRRRPGAAGRAWRAPAVVDADPARRKRAAERCERDPRRARSRRSSSSSTPGHARRSRPPSSTWRSSRRRSSGAAREIRRGSGSRSRGPHTTLAPSQSHIGGGGGTRGPDTPPSVLQRCFVARLADLVSHRPQPSFLTRVKCGSMDFSLLATIALYAVPVVFAITLHEAAHGYVARMFGDQTAWMLGRVTLNPLKHIDPIGTVLLPAILVLIALADPVRLGKAGAGQFRQSAQSEARHALGRRCRSGGEHRDGDWLGAVAEGRGTRRLVRQRGAEGDGTRGSQGQCDADGVQSDSDPPARRRTRRREPAAAVARQFLCAASSRTACSS